MAGRLTGLLVIMAIAAVVALALALQRQELRLLESQVELAREQARELAAAKARSLELSTGQASPSEMERLRANRSAVIVLRRELADLKTRVAQPSPPAPQAKPPEVHPWLSTSQWRNVGRATPRAAVETLFWAAAGGDVEAVAQSLLLEPPARAHATALLSRVPADTRERYASPELLVAFLTVTDVPFPGSMRVAQQTGGEGDEARLLVGIRGTRRADTTEFALRRQGDGWKLVVPLSAVESYAAALKIP